MDSQRMAVVGITLTVLFWGISYSSTIVALTAFSPLQVAFIRVAVATVAWHIIIGKNRKIERSDWPRMAAAGLVGIPVYHMLENSGLALTTAGSGSLIIAAIPGLNVLVGRWLWKERLPFRQLVGVWGSILGVALIVVSQFHDGYGSLLGNLLMVGAALSWVAFIRINQPLTEKYPPLQLIYWQTGIGAYCLGVLTLMEKGWQDVAWSSMKVEVVGHMAFLTFFCSGIGYLFYYHAQGKLGPTVTTTFINLIPVFGVLSGVLILKESVTTPQLIGGLVVISGVWLVTRRPKAVKIPAEMEPLPQGS